MEGFDGGRLPLKCEKCLNVEKTQRIDQFGNIHISLWCKKRYFIVSNVRNVGKCKHYVYKGELLDRWFGKAKGLNTCNM